jgi:glycosyltransferase involved in cell wall biosynthesis
MKRTVFLNWPLADHYGWGVFALNLMLWGLKHPRFTPQPLQTEARYYQPMDPLMKTFLSSPPTLSPKEGDIMLHALGNVIAGEPLAPKTPKMTQIGVSFLEPNPLPDEHYAKLRQFDGIIAGSHWNQRVLSANGVNARCAHQGVDLDLFRAQTKRLYTDRFVVFSAGQLHHRKGQDLVVKAFSVFARHHPDALLVTAWRSPWERETAPTLNMSQICRNFEVEDDMHQAINNWALANGIAPEQFLALPAFGNALMPEILREVDLALFTSRCEGGTNLIAMEALACGITCAISANTGHLDIIKNGNCVALQPKRYGTTSMRMADWGDCDVDQIIGVLEDAYAGKVKLDNMVIRASMYPYSWKQAVDVLFSQIEIIEQRPLASAVTCALSPVVNYQDALGGFLIEQLSAVPPNAMPAAVKSLQDALAGHWLECVRLSQQLGEGDTISALLEDLSQRFAAGSKSMK